MPCYNQKKRGGHPDDTDDNTLKTVTGDNNTDDGADGANAIEDEDQTFSFASSSDIVSFGFSLHERTFLGLITKKLGFFYECTQCTQSLFSVNKSIFYRTKKSLPPTLTK